MHIELPDMMTRYVIRRDVTIALWMTLAVLAAAALTAFGWSFPSSSLQHLSDTFLRDVQMNKAQSAYALTSNDYKTRVDESEFHTIVDRASHELHGNFTLQHIAANGYAYSPGLLASPKAEMMYVVKTPAGPRYVRIRIHQASRILLVDDFQWSTAPLQPHKL